MAKEKEKENRENRPKKRRWNYKKITIALVILVLLLAIVVLGFVFKTQLLGLWNKAQGGTFTYHNMTFNKTYFGNLLMYQTDLAIYRPIQNNTLYWQLKLRNDPRELDKDIAANLTDKVTRKVYISFDKEPLECNETILAAYKLGEFMDALGAYKEATFANEALANENNNTYKVKNCSHAQDEWSVIMLKQSNTDKSYIHQDGKCYIMEIANCETIESSERLILALIDTMKGQAQVPESNETNITNTSSG